MLSIYLFFFFLSGCPSRQHLTFTKVIFLELVPHYENHRSPHIVRSPHRVHASLMLCLSLRESVFTPSFHLGRYPSLHVVALSTAAVSDASSSAVQRVDGQRCHTAFTPSLHVCQNQDNPATSTILPLERSMGVRNPYAVGIGTPSPLEWLWTWSDLWLCMLASVMVVGVRRAAGGGWVPKKVVVRFITGRRRLRWGAGR